jgi:hypothetical protein
VGQLEQNGAAPTEDDDPLTVDQARGVHAISVDRAGAAGLAVRERIS